MDSWYWEFGDGNTSTLANPYNIYHVPAVYTVKLRVSSVWGVDSMEKKNYVVATGGSGQPPKASFSTTGDYMRLNCSDNSTNNPTAWAWDFDAASNPGIHVSNEQNPTHFYDQVGTYLVCLSSSNSFGSDSSCKYVTTKVPRPPEADFAVELRDSFKVKFIDKTLNEPSQWNWDFGDGNTSIKEHPLHTYSGPGVRNVCLTVYNLSGNSFKCKSVQVFNVGLGDSRAKALQVWPIPASTSLFLARSDDWQGRLTIMLRDVSGKVLQTRIFDPEMGGVLDLTALVQPLPPGLYLLQALPEVGDPGVGQVIKGH